MNTSLERCLAALERRRLPALADNLDALRAACADRHVSLQKVAAVIARDPGLTLALLRWNNALTHRHLNVDINTVSHCLLMMGLGRVPALTEEIPLLEQLEPAPLRERLRQLYGQAQHAALQAREWAVLRRDTEPDEVYVAAQLRNLGRMLLWLEVPAPMARLEALATEQRQAPDEAEYVVLGSGIDPLAAALAERWRLPRLLQQTLQPENATDERVYGVVLAHRLAEAAVRGWYGSETTRLLEQIASHLGYGFGAAAAQVHQVAVQSAHQVAGQMPSAAARLLDPAQPDAAPARHAAEAASGEPAQGYCLVPQKKRFRQVVHLLEQPEQHSREQLLRLALDGMHEGLGLNRAVFAAVNRAGTRLRALYLVGAESNPVFNRFVLELEADDALSELLARPQALWLGPHNRHTLESRIPATLFQATGIRSFYVMSLFEGERPAGLFYADRHLEHCPLDADTFTRFQWLVELTRQALARRRGV